jgi:hypothetical protein
VVQASKQVEEWNGQAEGHKEEDEDSKSLGK